MLAVITSGGKQYQVKKGSIINVENPNIKVEEEFTINSVHMVYKENGDLHLDVADKTLNDACVIAKVVKLFYSPKVLVFKKKQRKNYRRKKGHKQYIAQIKIIDIKV